MNKLRMRGEVEDAQRGQGRAERPKNIAKFSVSSTRKKESGTHQPAPCSCSRRIPIPIRITARAHRLRGLNNFSLIGATATKLKTYLATPRATASPVAIGHPIDSVAARSNDKNWNVLRTRE